MEDELMGERRTFLAVREMVVLWQTLVCAHVYAECACFEKLRSHLRKYPHTGMSVATTGGEA